MSPEGPIVSGLDGDEATRFFGLLESTPSALLLLDYDGTLAPFRPDPAEAVPYPGVDALLRDLMASGGTRLAIVTGRSLESILPLLKLSPLPEIWASHGRERRRPGGEVRRAEPTEAQQAGLARALGAARSAGLDGRVEEKPFSVAFHVRGVSKEIATESLKGIRALWEPMTERATLALHVFDGGLELRAPGRSKADAVESLLGGYSTGAPAAYLGDDETDEDAFRALGERGLPVLVRPEWRETAARLWLRPPEELLRFMELWLGARGKAPGSA